MAGLTRRAGALAGVVLCVLLAVAALEAVAPMATAAAAETAGEGSGHIMPDQPTGAYPTSRYEIWYDDGGLGNVAAKVIGLATELTFAAVRMLVSATDWLISWAYSFRLAGSLAEPAAQLAGMYEAGLVGPLQLRHLALFAAVVYAGVAMLRNRLAHGVGELLVSLLVLAIAGAVLADPAETYRTGIGVTAGLSAAVLELAGGAADEDRDAPDGAPASAPHPDAVDEDFAVDTAAVAPLTEGLRRSFIAYPHDILNWGQPPSGDCADQRDQILAEGPHGSTSDRPRELMAEGGEDCEQLADWNAHPTMERLMGAGLVVVAALVVLVALGLVALTVVIAQLVGVALVGITPFALVGGVLPGAGRQLLWRWLTAGLRCVVVIVAMAGVLSFLLVTVQALLSHASGSLLERFGLLVVVTLAVFVLRRRVMAGARSMADNLGRRMESARTGGTHGSGWMRPAASGGLSGFGVSQMAQEGRGDVSQVRAQARRAGHRVAHPRGTPSRGHSGPGAPGAAGSGDSRAGRLGQAGRRVAHATTTTARGASRATVDLPRAGPRAAARARVATGEATRTARQRLHTSATRAKTAGREWAHGARHPWQATRAETERLHRERGEQRRRQAAEAQLNARMHDDGEEG